MEGHPGGQRDPAHHRGGGVHQRWYQHENDAEQRELDDSLLSQDDLEYLQAFTVAKRTLEGQDMIYQSIKLSNGIWALIGESTLGAKRKISYFCFEFLLSSSNILIPEYSILIK